MKKNLILTALLVTLSASAQVTDVITGQFAGATDAIVTGDDMHIADFLNGAIQRVDLSDPNPTVQDSFPFVDPFVLIIEGPTAYVADAFGDFFSVDSNDFASNITPLGSSFGLIVDMALIGDYLYFSDLATDTISRIDLNNPGTIETVIDSVNGPQGLQLIGDELFIAISADNTIGKININDTTPQIEIVASGFDNPGALISSGNLLFIAEPSLSNGRILRIDTSVNNPTVDELATNLSNPLGLAIYDGDLYFVQNGGSGILSRLDDAILSTEDQGIATIDIAITPNPSSGIIQLSGLNDLQLQEISIYDNIGRIVSQIDFASNQYIENTPVTLTLAPGLYIAVIGTDQGIAKRKIIVR